ncbi:hypothetical protein BD560DRAFT_339971, partial [Blakeslea trispora]
ICEVANLDWSHWKDNELLRKKPESSLRKLLDFADYQTSRNENRNKVCVTSPTMQRLKTIWTRKKKTSKVRLGGSYRSYFPEQVRNCWNLI